jgi:hypothetical protein
MRYPQALIEHMGGATAFAEKASRHPDAPKKLTRDAVYMWAQRNAVPFMWRPIVREFAERSFGNEKGNAA